MNTRIPLTAAFFMTLAFTTPAPSQLASLPFKGEDFSDTERVYWGRAEHSASGVQQFGYDLGAAGFDAASGRWKEASGPPEENANWYVYGRPVYAMRSGTVIACWRNAPENPKTGVGPGKHHPELTKYSGNQTRIYGGGNGFWIQHADGTRAEYAHFQPGSAPSALCPNNAALLPAVINSPNVSDAWPLIRVPAAQQVQVQAGQLLGRVGNSGTSSAPHLHIHMETGGTAGTTKSGGSPVALNFRSGLALACSDNTFQALECGSGPYASSVRFAGQPIPPGPVLVWPSRTIGREYARHGFPVERYFAIFQHLADSEYAPFWIDAYSVGGQRYLNYVWHPATAAWRAYHYISPEAYQAAFDSAAAAPGGAYAPILVESAVAGRGIQYSAIFARNQPGSVLARHGLREAEHLEVMESARKQGKVPVNVSVVSLGGTRYYTVLYRAGSTTDWVVRSTIAEADYQQEYASQASAGRRPSYLNAYMHEGRPYLSAIFLPGGAANRKDRHGMSGAAYQSEYRSALDAGMLTRCVTSFDGASSQHRYAACWWK
jgi:hypothetical protein